MSLMEKRIRKGGIRTPEGFLFELTGGDVSLNFVNTVDSRPTKHPNELMPTYKELFSWGRQAGVLSRMQELNLLKKALRHPNDAETARKSAVGLRECLFQIFTRVIENKEILEDLLVKWNRFVQRSTDQYELIQSKEGFTWRCSADPLKYDSMVWPIIHSAAQLLTGPNVDRIRRCAADNCDWLFLDTSKRGNRRWCDMTICGNRAKAQRFYSKKKALPKSADKTKKESRRV